MTEPKMSFLPLQQKQDIVDDAMRLVQLHGYRNAFPTEASNSRDMAWRLSMAMQLVACPSMLVVDEIQLGEGTSTLSSIGCL